MTPRMNGWGVQLKGKVPACVKVRLRCSTRLDLSGIEALVFGGHRVRHLSPVGPHDGGSRGDLEASGPEGEILHRSVHGAARGGRVGTDRRSRLRAGARRFRSSGST